MTDTPDVKFVDSVANVFSGAISDAVKAKTVAKAKLKLNEGAEKSEGNESAKHPLVETVVVDPYAWIPRTAFTGRQRRITFGPRAHWCRRKSGE